jgi:hypothetical protein
LLRIRAEALKGHLDGLLLAALEPGPLHGDGVIDHLRAGSGGRIDLPTGTMAGCDVARDGFDAYLDAVGVRLVGPRRARAAILDELRDGLHEAAAAGRRRFPDIDTDVVERVAVREFGPAHLVAAAFAGELACSQARRTVTVLLATGPLVGVLWLMAGPQAVASVIATGSWRVVPSVPLVAVAVLVGAVVLLATGRLGASFERSQMLAVDGAVVVVASAVVADLVMLAVLLSGAIGSLAGVSLVMVLAICASLGRLSACGLQAAHVLGCRASMPRRSPETRPASRGTFICLPVIRCPCPPGGTRCRS